MATYRVSELAERVGLPASTLRFYDQAGPVPARRSESGYRLFDDKAVARVEVITTGKRLGLGLEDIRDLLMVWEDGLCRDVRERLRPMVLDRITDAERRTAETEAFIERLRQALDVLDGPVPPGRCGPGCGIGELPQPAADPARPAQDHQRTGRSDSGGHRDHGQAEQHRRVRLPIACTLTGNEQADRVGEWRRLVDRADDRERIAGGLAFRFPLEMAGEVAALAAAEHQCCPFMEFTLRMADGALRFEVLAPADAAPMLDMVFG